MNHKKPTNLKALRSQRDDLQRQVKSLADAVYTMQQILRDKQEELAILAKAGLAKEAELHNKWGVLRVSNYDLDSFAQSWHLLPTMTEAEAQKSCVIACNSPSRPHDVWYRAEPADCKLWRGMEELV